MSKLEDTVKQVVNDFVKNSTLFTALDVSNAVKTSHPLARHREVRDLVRNMYSNIVSLGYGQTPISVTLADGSQVTANLYHHLSDSWDLDNKYDDQKRAQVALNPANAAICPSLPSVSVVSSVPVVVSAPAVSVPANTPVTVANPKQLWDSLFSGGARLFPTS